MKATLALLLFALAGGPVVAASPRPSHAPAPTPGRAAATSAAEVDSAKLEQELQRLPWKQFRAVVESIPKLKAGIDAYGPMGWQFVEQNYRSYGWKRNIDKLDDGQKRRLAELIRRARSER